MTAGYAWVQTDIDQKLLTELQSGLGISRPIALALARLGFSSGTAEKFLNPNLSNLSNPFDLPGTEKAAERLWQAIDRGEKILIHGDYDTDGITASVLLSSVLTENGANTEVFLPHRIDDGYGLTEESIEKACSTDFSLLVTVDCGITSHDAVECARSRGLDVIVTDHHEPCDTLPEALAVIDPKLPGAPECVKELAGVGVAFKVCHAFLKYGRDNGLGGHQTDLKNYLDLVALGTVADIVPLLHENRCLVRYGLGVLSKQQRPGIRALCDVAGLNGDVIRAPDIAFRIAPRVNAPGRMGDASLSMNLLLAQGMADAFAAARTLDDANRARQQLEQETAELAEKQLIDRNFSPDWASIVAHGQEWHAGVLGIVAARLARSYHRPAVVLSLDSSDAYSGSVRSITGINIIEVLDSIAHLLDRHGGHAMAAGLSLQPKNLEAFIEAFEHAVAQHFTEEHLRPQLEICGIASIAEFDGQFFDQRDLLEPFGHSNPEPVFLCRDVRPDRIFPAGKNHARGALRDLSNRCINFIAFGKTPESFPPPPWDVVVKPQLNYYMGRCTPQVEILDLRPAGIVAG